MINLVEIEIYTVSNYMHTALRKCCDSKATSALWNAIHVLQSEDVIPYWDAVTEALKDQKFDTVFDLGRAARDAWADVDYMGAPGRTLLHCLGDLMDEDDWCNFVSFLEDR